MYYKQPATPTHRYVTGFVLLLAFLLASCASSYYSGLQEQIPEGANRIILVQEDVPPAEVYVDALEHFERADYTIMASEETLELHSLADLFTTEGALTFSARKQVRDDLALRITGDVREGPEGNRLISSVQYAPAVTAPVASWHEASWTEGPAKEAYFLALEELRHTSYDATRFEVEAAIADMQ